MWISIISMLILDAVWIVINQKRYAKLVLNVQHKPMNIRMGSALIAYLTMVLGLIFIIIPNAKRDPSHNKIMKALKHGALFGFVVYSIYNATNYAVFDGYQLHMALLDTLWGTSLFFIITWIALCT